MQFAKLLGVEVGATKAELKSAYNAALGGAAGDMELISEINEAFKMLSNKAKLQLLAEKEVKRDEKKKSDAGAKGDKKGKNGTKAVKAKGGVKKTSSKPKAKQAAAPEPAGEPAAVVPAAAEAPTLEPKPEPVQA